jgi:hypothetical protein
MEQAAPSSAAPLKKEREILGAYQAISAAVGHHEPTRRSG